MQKSLSVTCGRLVVFSWYVSSTNKADRHDITEILLKVALNTIIPLPLYIETKPTTNVKPYMTGGKDSRTLFTL
jgi:hypothetical protein